MDISRIGSFGSIEGTNTAANDKTSKTSFQDILKEAIEQTNRAVASNEADTLALLTGESTDLHTSMIEMEKAELALQFTIQVRNKILDAYNEIMRMQL